MVLISKIFSLKVPQVFRFVGLAIVVRGEWSKWRIVPFLLSSLDLQLIFIYCKGYHQYIGGWSPGCSVPSRRKIPSVMRKRLITVERYHQYCGSYSVLWKETIRSLGIISGVHVASLYSTES